MLPDAFSGAVSVLVATVVAFILLTLTASYYRFQHIVEVAESFHPEDAGASSEDVMRVQVARFLSNCAHNNLSFVLTLLRCDDLAVSTHIGAPLAERLKEISRSKDVICFIDEQTLLLLMEGDPEALPKAVERILKLIDEDGLVSAEYPLRAGMASYPAHGLSGKALLAVAELALEETSADKRIVLPEVIDPEDEGEIVEDEEIEEELLELSKRFKDAPKIGKKKKKESFLDELTGVLKPASISPYMQRLMGDHIYKKIPICLFSLGINNIEQVRHFHGDDAVDDVLVEVSKVLQETLRVDDLIGRHEETAFLLLVRTPLEYAERIAKRLSTSIQRMTIVSGNTRLKVTVTLGVAAFPEHGKNLHQLYLGAQRVLDYSRENDLRAYAVYTPRVHDKTDTKPLKSIVTIKGK